MKKAIIRLIMRQFQNFSFETATLALIFYLFFALVSCQRQSVKARNVLMYENTGDGKEVSLENDFLKMRFLPETAEIILADKKSGAVWRSSPENAESDDSADVLTRQLMRSQFSLEYADGAGVGMTLFSGRHSVERGGYEYALDGETLEVRYTVGNIAKTYIFPAAAAEKRMDSFLEKMERTDRRKVEASYRLYDINNLRSGDNKNTLLALYPDLAREKVYVLRDNTQEYMRSQIEEFFAAAGYTYDDYLADTARFISPDGAEKPAFNVTLRYTLEGNSLLVSAPFDQIAWRQAYPLTQLALLPFMGAGGINDQGYLFVPDGSGALVYFNNGRQNQVAYNTAVYGWDEGMPREAVVNDNKAPYPVFGIQKNGAALLCIIEEGSAYAGIRADVSGRNCSYNSVYARFDMVHGAKMDISGRSDRAVYLYETSLPADERLTLRFTPCAGSGYTGMAKEYRSWLVRRYPHLAKNAQAGVPVAVEIAGAVNKTQHRLGLPFDLPLALTSYREAASMIQDFAGFGWQDVNIKLTGWFNRSVDHSAPLKIKLIGELGGKRDFRNLVKTAGDKGFNLFPEADFFYIKDNTAFDGFSLYRDVARYVNRERMETYPYSFVWFGERSQWGKLSFLARPAFMMKLIDGFAASSAKLDIENIAFRTIGSKLAGDYNEKRHVSREAAMNMRQEKLAGLSRAGKKIMINTGFAYAAPHAAFITDLALGDQGFGITDVSVPFYQIALHGLVPYTGRAINLAEDYTGNLLQTIESGAGLYFSFMAAETAELQETKFRQFYANEYDKWVRDADALYKQFTVDFAGLYALAIGNHTILAPAVTLTEYEDGTAVLVNRGSGAFDYKGVHVGSFDYAVFRQGE